MTDELNQRIRSLEAERARLTPQRPQDPVENLAERAARLLTKLQATYGELWGESYPQDPGTTDPQAEGPTLEGGHQPERDHP